MRGGEEGRKKEKREVGKIPVRKRPLDDEEEEDEEEEEIEDEEGVGGDAGGEGKMLIVV